MNDREYLKLWRKAVDAFLLAPKLHDAGLCYGLTRAAHDHISLDFYDWVANFTDRGAHSYISAIGCLSPIRQTLVLLMAELDDETILYIRNNKS